MLTGAYRRLIQLGKVTGAVSFLIAAPYALAQYIEAREAARVEQTLSFFKMYNAVPYSGYREKFTRALIKNRDLIEKAAPDGDAYGKLQLQILSQEDIETETFLLFDFFDGVAVCVSDQLCDSNTAIELFKPRAADIYFNFYQFMVVQRDKTGKRDFGAGVEAIARSQPTARRYWFF